MQREREGLGGCLRFSVDRCSIPHAFDILHAEFQNGKEKGLMFQANLTYTDFQFFILNFEQVRVTKKTTARRDLHRILIEHPIVFVG